MDEITLAPESWRARLAGGGASGQAGPGVMEEAAK